MTIATTCFTAISKATASDKKIDYANDVQPILAKRCYACHGPDDAEGGLRFHDSETALAQGDSGEIAIVPGNVDTSHLLVRITTDDEYERMPPDGDRVTDSELAILRQWIAEGAEFTDHWAFEPLSDPIPPLVDGTSNPIDAFLVRDLNAAGLSLSPPADKRTLIRRVTYDLTGLPPTIQDVDAFLVDEDPRAYEKLIDRLLDSHHYGERWGRHWLDVVRYAETNSFERDNPKPNAWKYRDYVIRSFNEDKPYDQFVREQIAGDQLDSVTAETLTATGYYRLGIWDDEPADPLQARFDELDDLITTTGQTFLGLTINCARCHDHKIDPIPQTDYYGMLAFFADVSSYGTRADQVSANQLDTSTPELRQQYADLDAAIIDLERRRTEIEQAGILKMSGVDQRATEGGKRERNQVLQEKLRDHLTAEQSAQYDRLTSDWKARRRDRDALPNREKVLGLGQLRPVDETFVLFRGNPHSPTDAVSPRFPTISQSPAPEMADDARRRTLADWMTRPDNRFTSRVMVNRIWQHHFGRGIVRSPNNFGMLGEPPTHPELLDYLAQSFVRGGWKIKPLHRSILMSAAYRQSAAPNDDGQSIDPGNHLFWRFDPRRLSAEEVRDSVLAVNGQLNATPYGPSFYPALSAEVLAGQSKPGQNWGDSDESQRNRRSVYVHVKRSLLTPMLAAFDFPEPDTTCEARFATLQPAQAMAMLNSDFIHEEAADLASLALRNCSESDRDNPAAFVTQLIRQTLQREPRADEIIEATELITDLVNDYQVAPDRALTLAAISVLNWNEFMFVF